MSRELITHQELLSQLRQNGYEDIQKIKRATWKVDGRVSLIPYESRRRLRSKH
jgi:uncharacterized membrane protein YcaP (DUF421 family)